MRLPRDVSGEALIARLRRYGYEPVRQQGSHVRLTRATATGEHNVSIPRHRVIKVGLLGAIVADVAAHLGRDRDEFSEELFG